MNFSTLSHKRVSLSGDRILESPSIQGDHETLLESPKTVEPIKPIVHNFTSGHQVEMDIDGQEIRIQDRKGQLAVRIELKPEGPVVELEGAKLSLRSPKSVDVHCEDFRVNAQRDIHLNANGQLTIESTNELHLNCEVDVRIRGKVIWLN